MQELLASLGADTTADPGTEWVDAILALED
jgi:hypothetical protein